MDAARELCGELYVGVAGPEYSLDAAAPCLEAMLVPCRLLLGVAPMSRRGHTKMHVGFAAGSDRERLSMWGVPRELGIDCDSRGSDIVMTSCERWRETEGTFASGTS